MMGLMKKDERVSVLDEGANNMVWMGTRSWVVFLLLIKPSKDLLDKYFLFVNDLIPEESCLDCVYKYYLQSLGKAPLIS